MAYVSLTQHSIRRFGYLTGINLVRTVVISDFQRIMPLVVPDLVEPKSNQPEQQTETKEKQEDKAAKSSDAEQTTKKVDGHTAPGMEGMSEEAIRKFEEAMELEYQKREGGA